MTLTYPIAPRPPIAPYEPEPPKKTFEQERGVKITPTAHIENGSSYSLAEITKMFQETANDNKLNIQDIRLSIGADNYWEYGVELNTTFKIIETVENRNYKTALKAYEKEMKRYAPLFVKYQQEIKEYELAAAQYKKDLKVFNANQKKSEIELLESRLQELKDIE